MKSHLQKEYVRGISAALEKHALAPDAFDALRTMGQLALVGALPGAVAGSVAAGEGHRVDGALRGGLLGGGTAGLLGHSANFMRNDLRGYVRPEALRLSMPTALATGVGAIGGGLRGGQWARNSED